MSYDHLTPEQRHICLACGTEPPFSSPLLKEKRTGTYHCVCCDAPMFHSEAKFDSGTGWPSFYAPIQPTALSNRTDRSHGMVRTEVRCAQCDAHLGHLFEDGPPPTGLRYCINGVCLTFKPFE